jgi:hypothetical protein
MTDKLRCCDPGSKPYRMEEDRRVWGDSDVGDVHEGCRAVPLQSCSPRQSSEDASFLLRRVREPFCRGKKFFCIGDLEKKNFNFYNYFQ